MSMPEAAAIGYVLVTAERWAQSVRCECGRYPRYRYLGVTCEVCGTEVRAPSGATTVNQLELSIEALSVDLPEQTRTYLKWRLAHDYSRAMCAMVLDITILEADRIETDARLTLGIPALAR